MKNEIKKPGAQKGNQNAKKPVEKLRKTKQFPVYSAKSDYDNWKMIAEKREISLNMLVNITMKENHGK